MVEVKTAEPLEEPELGVADPALWRASVGRFGHIA
jgi:hypothetical protein